LSAAAGTIGHIGSMPVQRVPEKLFAFFSGIYSGSPPDHRLSVSLFAPLLMIMHKARMTRRRESVFAHDHDGVGSRGITGTHLV